MRFAGQRFSSWSLQRKIAAVVAFVVLAGIVTDLSIQKFVIAPSFDSLEQDQAVLAARHCVSTFNQEVQRLRLLAENWAAWDDTYQFAADANELYIKSNLSLAAFRHAHLHLICIFDTQGKRVWGAVYRPQSQTLATSDPVLDFTLPNEPAAGLFLSRDGPMILAALPIHTNAGAGPSRGILVMGEFVDDTLIANLAEQAGAGLTIWPALGGALPEDKAVVLGQLSADSPFVCRKIKPKTISVFTVLPDIQKGSGALLEADIPEYITPKGVLATRKALISSLASGILILGVLVLFLQDAVIHPIRDLTKSVVRFTLSGAVPDPTVETRGDEIGVLSKEFDAMKSRLLTDIELRQQSEARMQAILVSAPDGIITADEQGVIESVNPAAADMFGYDPGELAGKNWRILVTEPVRSLDEKALVNAFRERSAKTQTIEYENTGVRKDGSTFPLHVTASRIELGDKRIVLGIFRDITELTRMHERVLRSEHLAAIGEMGASVAHEIRNPIAGISGAIQVLRDTLTPEDTRREIIREMIAQVSRVDQTLRELLMLAKPWSPEMTLCSVGSILNRAIEQAKSQDSFQHVVFELHTDNAAFANLDEFLMEQVLWNLFRNAAQAMPNGGNIRCSVTDTAQSVRIVVADTGEGIPSDIVDKVFRPFFTTRTRGTGLGLPVARQIVEAHGGGIFIESVPGEGTCISLDLPRAEVPWQVAS